MSTVEEGPWRYEILCVDHETTAGGHRHVSAAGTANLGGTITDLPVDRVLELMAEGDEFYTIGSHSGVEVEVEAYTCSCGIQRIRTRPDDEQDNSLDSLPTCSERP